jgi:hypothetical protein
LTVCTTRRGHAELEARSNRLAHFLRSVGLKRLDHYSIFTENNARYVECCDTWPTKPKRCAVSICTEAAWDAEQRAVEAGIRTDADADADAATLDELALAGVRAVRYVTRRRITGSISLAVAPEPSPPSRPSPSRQRRSHRTFRPDSPRRSTHSPRRSQPLRPPCPLSSAIDSVTTPTPGGSAKPLPASTKLGKSAGYLSLDDMRRVDAALRIVLDLQHVAITKCTRLLVRVQRCGTGVPYFMDNDDDP